MIKYVFLLYFLQKLLMNFTIIITRAQSRKRILGLGKFSCTSRGKESPLPLTETNSTPREDILNLIQLYSEKNKCINFL